MDDYTFKNFRCSAITFTYEILDLNLYKLLIRFKYIACMLVVISNYSVSNKS